MPGPTLTLSEQLAIETTIGDLTASQGESPVQARPGNVDELLAVGVRPEILAVAQDHGVLGAVDRYDGPYGKGWTLRLHLVRDGVAWIFRHHVGPETYRDAKNGWALNDDPLGGA